MVQCVQGDRENKPPSPVGYKKTAPLSWKLSFTSHRQPFLSPRQPQQWLWWMWLMQRLGAAARGCAGV